MNLIHVLYSGLSADVVLNPVNLARVEDLNKETMIAGALLNAGVDGFRGLTQTGVLVFGNSNDARIAANLISGNLFVDSSNFANNVINFVPKQDSQLNIVFGQAVQGKSSSVSLMNSFDIARAANMIVANSTAPALAA